MKIDSSTPEASAIRSRSTESTSRDSADTQSTVRAIYRVLVAISLMLGANLVYFGRDLVMPLILGLLLALTLSPVVRLLARFRIPSPIGASMIVVSAGAVILLGTYSLSGSISEMMDSAPEVRDRIELRLQDLQEPIESVKQASDELGSLVESMNNEEVSTVVVEQPSIITSAASTLATSATTFAIALFMALFILSTGTLFHEKLIVLMPVLSEKKKALRIVYDVESQVSRYLLTITVINACLGLVIWLLMYALNMPNPVMWGVVVMCLNFLPFIGAIIGAVAVGLVAMTSMDSIGAALLIPAIYYGSSVVEGSLITPFIIGHRLSLNIVALFLSVTIWSWLWGMPGALMAVPILVVVKVICDHVQGWAAFGHFLAGRSTWKSEPVDLTPSK